MFLSSLSFSHFKEPSPPLYVTNKQQHRRTWLSAGCWTLFPLKTISCPIGRSYFQSWCSVKVYSNMLWLHEYWQHWVVLVCLINIGTCAQWDAQINCAQVPPLIKQTCNEPITKGCCHYLYSCTHGANMDSTVAELATLRAPPVPRDVDLCIFYLH